MRTVVWQSLSEAQQESILERPAITEGANITAAVAQVIAKVRSEGDAALFELTEKFDRVKPASLRVSREEMDAAAARLSETMKQALEQAYNNISNSTRRKKRNQSKWKPCPEWCVSKSLVRSTKWVCIFRVAAHRYHQPY